MFDVMPVSAVLINQEGLILEVSQPWQKYAAENGHPDPSSFIGTNYLQVCGGVNDPNLPTGNLKSAITEVLSGQVEAFVHEYPCHSPDALRWFRMKVRLLQRGERAEAIILHVEITDEKISEFALRRQTEILDLVNDSIFVVDLDDRVLYANKGASEHYGVSADEIVGKIMYEEQTPDGKAAFEAAKAELLRNGKWSGQLARQSARGEQITIGARWRLIQSQCGNEQILKVHTDLSFLSQLLRTQRLQSVGQMAGGIAHDLNNILTPLLISAEEVAYEREAPLPEVGARIVMLAERATGLIRQLLGYARGFEGDHKIESAATLLQEIKGLVEISLPTSIKLNIVGHADSIRVSCNKTQIHQVLLNLCLNGRDAISGKGELTLTMSEENCAARRTFFGATITGRYLVFRVTDTGCGMTEAQLEHAFQPFFTTKAPGRGTGLGLSTCLGIAKSHNGFVDVESTVGQGSTFSAYLPVEGAANEGIRVVALVDRLHVRLVETILSRVAGQVQMTSLSDEAFSYLLNSEADVDLFIAYMGAIENDVEMVVNAARQFCSVERLLIVEGQPFSLEQNSFLEAAGVQILRAPFDANAFESAVRAAAANRSERS